MHRRETKMSKQTVCLECSDPDIAMFMIAIHAIYEGDISEALYVPLVIVSALENLRDQTAEALNFWENEDLINGEAAEEVGNIFDIKRGK